MKKLLSILATTLTMGMTSTGLAEENPSPVKLSGKIKYTSIHSTLAANGAKAKSSSDSYTFQLDTLAKVNSHWTANARIEAEGEFRAGKTLEAKLPHVWIEGNYDNFNIRLGKMELLTNENGLLWDTDLSGAHFTVGNKLKFSGMGGQISTDNLDERVLQESESGSHSVDFGGVNLQYENFPGLFGGAGWYIVTGDSFKTSNYVNSIVSVNLGYIFSEKFIISGSYAQNVMAVEAKYSWQTVAVLGNYGDYPERGDWQFLAGYRQYGTGVSFAPTKEDVLKSSRGWFVGTTYAPLKNIGLDVKFFKGKDLESGISVKNIFGRVEVFF